jgi:hypothetical protein
VRTLTGLAILAVVDTERSVDGVEPRWRVRQNPLPWWRRWLDRRLALADVVAPDGARYNVRVLRNVPLRGSPLGPFDNLVPTHFSLPVLVAANLYARGRTGWVLEVATAETAWRASHVIYARRVRGGVEVADLALELAAAVQRGSRPWEDGSGIGVVERIRNIMNWD